MFISTDNAFKLYISSLRDHYEIGMYLNIINIICLINNITI